MIKKIIYILYFLSSIVYCQTKTFDEANKSGNISKVLLEDNCEEIKALVEIDIKNDSKFIFLQGGIAPVRYHNDSDFEKKYNIYFYEQGCIGSKCSENYNFIIFDYLNKTYGEKWLKEIRKDALGLLKWKKNKKNKK
ncbi:hypothetical protein [Flavobacterium sp.]|jgi:hypothetical protein|uniref:FEKKY domain-containing protein n=1 Tax=Flavobacterium sp. TaxID=239 RepID=UPI0037BE9412